MAETKKYPAESVGSLLSRNVVTTTPSHQLKDVLKAIVDSSWDDIQYAYVLDSDHKLVGVVDLARSPKTRMHAPIRELMTNPVVIERPEDDQERVVMLAVKGDATAVPVVDANGIFLGAVIARNIIDVMHQEHLEDALLSSGIRGHGSQILKLATSRYRVVIGSRAPWLIFGAAVGLGLGLISSFFEKTLAQNVALAYFVPVVAYIADSVGTQSEAITIRALATLKVNRLAYMLRELIVGLALGAILGVIGGIGAAFIGGSAKIGFVVAISLFAASTLASALAALIPIMFKALGKDPALGSGPLATALQDVISVLVYFLVAVLVM